MKLFSHDIAIYATAYVKAETAEQAVEMLKLFRGDTLELPPGGLIEEREYSYLMDDPHVPLITLSPAMTVAEDQQINPSMVECVWEPDYVDRAIAKFGSNDVIIDRDAETNIDEDGTWVAAWVRVPT
jgi:hypothetical protein